MGIRLRCVCLLIPIGCWDHDGVLWYWLRPATLEGPSAGQLSSTVSVRCAALPSAWQRLQKLYVCMHDCKAVSMRTLPPPTSGTKTVCMYVVYDYIAVSTRTLTPPTACLWVLLQGFRRCRISMHLLLRLIDGRSWVCLALLSLCTASWPVPRLCRSGIQLYTAMMYIHNTVYMTGASTSVLAPATTGTATGQEGTRRSLPPQCTNSHIAIYTTFTQQQPLHLFTQQRQRYQPQRALTP